MQMQMQMLLHPCSSLSTKCALRSATAGRRNTTHVAHRSFQIAASQDNKKSCRIFVKGLPHSTGEGSLAKAFAGFGEVKRVKIITGGKSNPSLGFAYIWFGCEEDAENAVTEMHGKFLDGKFIAVTIANPEAPSKRGKARTFRF